RLELSDRGLRVAERALAGAVGERPIEQDEVLPEPRVDREWRAREAPQDLVEGLLRLVLSTLLAQPPGLLEQIAAGERRRALALGALPAQALFVGKCPEEDVARPVELVRRVGGEPGEGETILRQRLLRTTQAGGGLGGERVAEDDRGGPVGGVGSRDVEVAD